MKYLFLLLCFVAPVYAHAEVIESFASDITIQQDGSFKVEETILYDFEETQRHGIYRDITKGHPQEATSFWKTRSIDITVDEVTLDGASVPYELSEASDNLNIKIGDADTTIDGLHTYSIVYTVKGGLSYFDDGTSELYWNVTGNGWEVPMRQVTGSIHGESAFFSSEHACYKGVYGVSTPCDTVNVLEDGVLFEALELTSFEGLTIAQGLNASVVETVIVERFNTVLFALIFLPLGALALIIFGYRYRTHFKTGASIIAQYEPYENFKPMYSGMLQDGVLDPRDITAGIVYLAEQGFIKIKKIDKKVLFLFEVDDYELQLLRPFSEIESPYLKDTLLLIFYENAPIDDIVTLSSLKTDYAKQKVNAVKLQTLRSDLKKDMRAQGFFQVNGSLLKPILILGGVFVGLFLLGDIIVSFAAPEMLLYLFIALCVCLIVFVIMYERRTRRGYEAVDHLKGFKLFLSVTDAERFKFHNAPEKSPEQFMEYLPYAIAFGVEKQWAKVFEGITIPNPGWYDSGGAGSFSAVNLTTSLGAFSTSFAASSGSSGSSGSGSSGGGGGGGGGGSW